MAHQCPYCFGDLDLPSHVVAPRTEWKLEPIERRLFILLQTQAWPKAHDLAAAVREGRPPSSDDINLLRVRASRMRAKLRAFGIHTPPGHRGIGGYPQLVLSPPAVGAESSPASTAPFLEGAA